MKYIKKFIIYLYWKFGCYQEDNIGDELCSWFFKDKHFTHKKACLIVTQLNRQLDSSKLGQLELLGFKNNPWKYKSIKLFNHNNK
jgi:hypothetical protein